MDQKILTLLTAAEKAYAMDEFTIAIASYTHVLKLDSTNRQALKKRAICYRMIGEYDNAIEDGLLLTSDQDNFEGFETIALSYLFKKDYRIAIQYFQKTIKALKKLQNEDTDWATGLDYGMNFAKSYNNMGICYYNLNEYNEAIEAWTHGIDNCPDYSNNYFVRGTLYHSLNKYDLAIPDLQRAGILGDHRAFASLAEIENELRNSLDFVFESSDHLRYENGYHVSGPHSGGARRAIEVKPNINGGEGYSVSIYNLDGNHPVWRNNIQMAPKQMKIVNQSENVIEFRGFGYDYSGNSFADYGLTINLKNGEILTCIMHMFDRGVDVSYQK